VPFDYTTPIYLINLLWKLGLGLGLDLKLHYFRIFMENNENEYLIFRELYIRQHVVKRMHPFDRRQIWFNKRTYSNDNAMT